MRIFLLGFALCAALLSGCASIVKGSTQDIVIATKPEGARFSVKDNRNGNTVREGVTPGNVSLEKGAGYFKGADYTVTLSKPGYESQNIEIDSSASGWYIGGNLLVGGLIGYLIVDPLTGAMWKLTPEGIDTQLASQTASFRPPMALPVSETTPRATEQPEEAEYQPLPEQDQARPTTSSAAADDPSKSVNERLEALQQRRARGEMSGEEYLAARNRIIYGN